MTAAQIKSFYIPRWIRLAQRLDWVMAGGRLVANLDQQYERAAMFSVVARDLVRAIIDRARQFAAIERRAVAADDLRYAMNWIASRGHHVSSKQMTNFELDEFDRMRGVLMKMAANEDHLETIIPYVNPEEDTRRRRVEYLRTLSYEAQLRAIARNNFQTEEWTMLNLEQLNRLVVIVKAGSSHGRKFSPNPF